MTRRKNPVPMTDREQNSPDGPVTGATHRALLRRPPGGEAVGLVDIFVRSVRRVGVLTGARQPDRWGIFWEAFEGATEIGRGWVTPMNYATVQDAIDAMPGVVGI